MIIISIFLFSILFPTFIYSQSQQKLTYSIIKELDVIPVNENNYSGEECCLQLKIPFVKADSVMASIPDLPAGINFVSLRRSEYADETSGTKIELWLNFSEKGTYKLKFLRVTINGTLYNIPFKPITILENPRNMLPQLVVTFDNGVELIQQKRSSSRSKIAFSEKNGVPLRFTVSLQYAVQLVSFYWSVPKNSLFTELERYEITTGTLRNSDFSEKKVPVASFEWQPLVTGNVYLPELKLIATAYNGSRVELSMPDVLIEILENKNQINKSNNDNDLFAYAFTEAPVSDKKIVKTSISNEDCIKIAELREKERNSVPFGIEKKNRHEFEKGLGIYSEESEPTHFMLHIFICLAIIFAVLLGMAIMLKKIPILIFISTLSIVFFVLSIISAVRLSIDYGIFIGGGIRAVPETSVASVESIESGRRVKVEQQAGGWVYIRVGASGGWILKENIIFIK